MLSLERNEELTRLKLTSPPVKRVIQPDWMIRDLISIVKNDPMTTARSAAAAARSIDERQVDLLVEANDRIGINAAASRLLAVFGGQTASFHQGVRGRWQEKYWQRSVIEAVVASVLAKACGDDPAPMRLAGLMTHVGVFELIDTAPMQYIPILEVHANSLHRMLRAERSQFGFTNVELSQRLLKQWAISAAVADAVQGQCDTAVDLLTEPNIEAKRMRCACFLASRIADLQAEVRRGNQMVIIESLGWKYFGIGAEALLRETGIELRRMGFDGGDLLTPAVLHSRSHAQLKDMLRPKHRLLS